MCTMPDNHTTHVARSSKVNCRKNFQQKGPVYPQYKKASFRARQPIFVSKLLIKLPRQDTQPSSASYRGSFPCTTPRIPRYATRARFRGTVPNLSQQATPSFADKIPVILDMPMCMQRQYFQKSSHAAK